MKALQIAKLNAEKNLVRKKIEFIESDMFDKIYKEDFDIILINQSMRLSNRMKLKSLFIMKMKQ